MTSDEVVPDRVQAFDHVPEQWGVYEANVQAYRQISLSTQSLLITAGAFLIEKDTIAFAAVGLMALALTWFAFFPAIFCRTAIVDFYKFRLYERFDAEGVGRPLGTDQEWEPLDERTYADFRNFALRQKVYHSSADSQRQPTRTMRTTRMKLDVVVPACLSFMWAVFAWRAFVL